MAFFTVLQLRNNSFRFALRAPLAVQPGAERSDDASKILNQILFSVLCLVDDLNPATLHRQQLLDVIESEAGQPVFVFPKSR